MSGFVSTFGKLDPLRAVNARIDPLANVVGVYGKNAPTPLDPLGIKMGMYGYQTQSNQMQAAAAPAQQPAQSTSALLADPTTVRRQIAAQGTTSKTLLGQ